LLHLSPSTSYFFFFNDTATTDIYTLSLHDALPISVNETLPSLLPLLYAGDESYGWSEGMRAVTHALLANVTLPEGAVAEAGCGRSEEHTSELQSRENLVCRLLLEKKKNKEEAESSK